MIVSVIIPFFNRTALLQEAVRSVTTQIISPDVEIEIILIDDCSHEQFVCEECPDNKINIKLIRNNENYGVSYSRNIGMENSTGQYIFFLDSDDRWFSSHVQDSLNALSTTNANALCSAYLNFDGRRILHKRITKKYLTFSDFDYINPVGLSTLVVKKDFLIFHNIQFPTIRMRNDFIFLKKITEYDSIFTKSSPTVLYRSHTGMTKRKSRLIRFQWETYRTYFNYSKRYAVVQVMKWAVHHLIVKKFYSKFPSV